MTRTVIPEPGSRTDAEIAWAAGLFEGEGCFFQRDNTTMRVSLTSTDLDVITRFHEIVGVGTVRPIRKHKAHYKQPYCWTVTHKGAYYIFDIFKPWLGTRRFARAEEIMQVRSEWLARHGERVCRCGKTFLAREAKAKFCSRRCKLDAMNIARRSERMALGLPTRPPRRTLEEPIRPAA